MRPAPVPCPFTKAQIANSLLVDALPSREARGPVPAAIRTPVEGVSRQGESLPRLAISAAASSRISLAERRSSACERPQECKLVSYCRGPFEDSLAPFGHPAPPDGKRGRSGRPHSLFCKKNSSHLFLLASPSAFPANHGNHFPQRGPSSPFPLDASTQSGPSAKFSVILYDGKQRPATGRLLSDHKAQLR